jgi:hypothetical protein
MNAHVRILPREKKNPPSDCSRGGFFTPQEEELYNLVARTFALAMSTLVAKSL